jgi:TolB protein
MKLRHFAVAVACLVLSSVSASARDLPRDRRVIAFSATRAGNVDIYVSRADGTGLRRLTRTRGDEDSPAWSPDGRKIAFRSTRDGDQEIYVMNADGSDRHNVSRNPSADDRSPAWSPDGGTIAYATGAGRGEPDYLNDIWLMSPDGGDKHPLTHRIGIDEYPVWSPDGSQIAFSCTDGRILPSRNGDFEICLVNRDGSHVRRLPDAPGVSLPYSWSPDGRVLAFASSRASNPGTLLPGDRLFLLDVSTLKVSQLTQGPAADFEPAFSPDGRKLAFASIGRRTRASNIYLLILENHRVKRVTHFTRGGAADPAWKPLIKMRG